MFAKGVRVPTLETDRLLLRRWTHKDAYELYEYAKNPDVGPHAGWRPHSSVTESRMIISGIFRRNTTWALEEKETGRVIGSIGFEDDKYRPGVKSKEMGYSLSKDHWGRGYMTEAATLLIRYAFEIMKLDIITIKTGDANIRSRRVIEKCGFKYEGTLRRAYRMYDGEIREMRCYSMLKEEYFG